MCPGIQISCPNVDSNPLLSWGFNSAFLLIQFSSVQFSRSVRSNSLQPHGLQHVRPPCPSPTPRVYSNSMSIESVMPSNHLIIHHPLLVPPSIFSSIRVFSNGLLLFFCLNQFSCNIFFISQNTVQSHNNHSCLFHLTVLLVTALCSCTHILTQPLM